MLIRALEALVRIEAPEPIGSLFAEQFASLVAPFESDSASDAIADITWFSRDDGRWDLRFRSEGHTRTTDVALGVADTINEISQLGARSVSDDHLVLHAGAFVIDGIAVGITGVVGAGKSTLVAAGVQRGHRYLTDDVCAIDVDTKQVLPFHRPIGLRPVAASEVGVKIPAHSLDAYEAVYPWRVTPESRLSGGAVLGIIALAWRRPGKVEITTLDEAEALMRLTKTVWHEPVNRKSFRHLDDLVRRVPMVILRYENSVDAIKALETHVEASRSGRATHRSP